MRHQRHTLLVAALVVAVIAVVPGGAVAADGLSVSGDQADDGTVTVTVAENNTTVANASVTVEALNNSSYVGEGNYTTDENGTVTLPAPEQNVSVSVTATADNTTAETTLDLVAPTDDTSDISVNVSQADDGNATVSVTNATGAGVANASVSVSEAGNVTYAGTGNYTTGENGTVSLPAPEQNVTVDVVAEADNATAATTVDLVAPTNDTTELSVGVSQASDGSASVSVTNASGDGVANASVSVDALDNVSYAGAGDYTTDESGTVGLPAPEQNVTIEVVAEANNVTAETTTTLTVSDGANATDSFGQRVSAFVEQLKANGNMSGQAVSAFVVANNPGADNRPDHVDPGPKDDGDDEESEKGNNGNGNGAGAANGNNGNGNNGNNGNGNAADGNNGNGNGADTAGGNGNNGNGGGNGPSSGGNSGGPGNSNAGGNGNPGNGA
ncbi:MULTISPECIES: hypothetical protein [Halobacterium]|uniref:hypothetical protein n=1 Tax=Halobacterium TaxID=2239 RepID=UPI00073EF324|nr:MULTISPECIES: hypothetical protein [Halobacterium]MCG1004378.1 hypothetical protein [Halobacterium noricense]